MRVNDYVSQVLGKVIWTEPKYGAQCVGTFKEFCQDIAGCGAYPTGNNNADGYMEQDCPDCFTKVSVNELRNGDWVIWERGCDQEHDEGHIAMYVDGQQLSQNQFGHDEVTLYDCNDWDKAMGALRWNGWDEYKQPDITQEDGAVYRFADKKSNYHFYTSDFNEVQNIINVYPDYQYEGVAFHSNGDVPVYRFYNPSNGQHMYTVSEDEKNTLINNGWELEGVGFNSVDKGTPIYRLFHSDYGHLFTSSTDEVNNCIVNGWQLEGVGWHE